MSFDEIFVLTAGVYFHFHNIIRMIFSIDSCRVPKHQLVLLLLLLRSCTLTAVEDPSHQWWGLIIEN